MSRELSVIVMLLVGCLVLGLMLWGWTRRKRRDSGLVAPVDQRTDAQRAADTGHQVSGLYVASTAHGAPLDRLVISGLAFRAKTDVTVSAAGVSLALAGERPVFLARDTLVGVDRATWTVDRVVEPGGLVLIAWRAADGTVVDSYLRLQGSEPLDLIARIDAILPIPASSSTESPA